MATVPTLRVDNCHLEVLPGRTSVVVWVLPGALPGVTWSVTWYYLGCYFGDFFCGPKISAFLNLKLLKNIFYLEMLPGPAPVLVT